MPKEADMEVTIRWIVVVVVVVAAVVVVVVVADMEVIIR